MQKKEIFRWKEENGKREGLIKKENKNGILGTEEVYNIYERVE